MSSFWQGYANITDDLRHTYEQVFYGRRLTADLTSSEVPGMAAVPVSDGPTVEAGLKHDHEALYACIWGAPDTDAPDTSPPASAPAPRASSDLGPDF